MNKSTKRILAVGLPLAAVAATGIAFAAWTSTGAGTGSATSTTIKDLTFGTSTTSSAIYPTGKSDIVTAVGNTNSYKALLSGWSFTAAYYSDDANIGNLGGAGTQPTDVKTTCALSLNTVPDTAIVPAGASTVTITSGLSMGNGAVNACAGKTFVLTLAANAASSAGTVLTTVVAS